jgi:hypothetical protein
VLASTQKPAEGVGKSTTTTWVQSCGKALTACEKRELPHDYKKEQLRAWRGMHGAAVHAGETRKAGAQANESDVWACELEGPIARTDRSPDDKHFP